MNGAEVRIVEEVDEECFGRFLQGHNSLTLPSVGTVLGGDSLRDFPYLRIV